MAKFRSFNKLKKEFIYFENGDYFYPNSDRRYQCSSNIFDWQNAEQYTGLKDRNGKEIYEGDVVKVSYELNESMSGSVIFRDSGYWLSDKDINYCCWLSSSSLREYEITGNIHE